MTKPQNNPTTNNTEINTMNTCFEIETTLTPLAIRYLDFRPYLDSIDIPVQTPKDNGYYYKITSNDGRLIRNTFEDNGFVETHGHNWTVCWSSSSIKSNIYLSLKPHQKVNHFPRSVEITRKDLLYKNLAKLQTTHKQSFNFVPLSFLLPNEYSFLAEAIKDKDMLLIVKPVASSQGRGIFVTNNIQEVI
jgi:tubulin polyglutamylase TTLL5